MTIAAYFASTADGSLGEEFGSIIAAFEEVTLLTMREEALLNDVLRLVGRRLCALLDVSRCSVYLKREDGLFQGRVGYCADRDIDAPVSRLVSGFDGDEFTKEIVATASPVLVRNADVDPRTVKRTMRRWNIHSMLGVPLVVENEVIGILYVDDQDGGHDYSDHDIKIAQAFAGLSALAVRHRWLHDRFRERAAVIEHQRRVLLQTSDIHNRLTRAVLDGEDISGILRTLVDLLNRPVVLYSPALEPKAWATPTGSEAIYPGLSVGERQLPWVRQAFSQLSNETSTVLLRVTPESGYRRLLVRMSIDQQCAGYLELSEVGRAFSALDGKALEQASTAVALKLLSEQRRLDSHERDREEHLADLLYARRRPTALRERSEQFGIDVDASHYVVRLQYSGTDVASGGGSADTARERRRSLARFVDEAFGGTAKLVADTSVPGAVLLLAQASDTARSADLKAGLDAKLAALTARFNVRFVVISDRCHQLQDLPIAAERSREVCSLLLRVASRPRVVHVREFGVLRLVTEREGLDGATRFAHQLLQPLIDHDRTTESELVRTLRAYLEANAQVRQAARDLGVHENTIRYRLARIRELSGIEPERFDSLLEVALALKVAELSDGEPQPVR